MILRWTANGFIWTLGDGWGENGPFDSYRDAIDDYEAYRQAQDAASTSHVDGRAAPPCGGVTAPRGDALALIEPRSAPFSFVDVPLDNDA